MRTSSKLLFIALTTAAVFSLAVSSASARRIEVSNQHFLAIWNPLIFSGGGATVRCPVTLEGSYHSKTISKVSGQLIGWVTEAAVNNAACAGGHATVLRENLPWHMRYDSFCGTLPEIECVKTQLVGARFRIEAFFSCLSTTSASNPGFGTIGIIGGEATEITASGSIPCGIVTGTFSGTGEVFVQENPGLSEQRIRIRLVQ
jgi:hypothetical protein